MKRFKKNVRMWKCEDVEMQRIIRTSPNRRIFTSAHQRIYTLIIFSLSFLIYLPAFSQNDSLNQTLDNIYQQAQQKTVALETADQMLKDARTISLNDLNDEQGDELMMVYRKVASVYADNYHFKPAYLVYNEYIGLKNSFLERKKAERLEKIGMETRQLENDNALKISANDININDLKDENETLLSAKLNVYRVIWIVVIIVAFCSGAMIWIITHKYNKAKHLLDASRSRMRAIAFTSAIGEFTYGIEKEGGNSYLTGIEELKNTLSKLPSNSSSQSKTGKEIASLISRLREAIDKL